MMPAALGGPACPAKHPSTRCTYIFYITVRPSTATPAHRRGVWTLRDFGQELGLLESQRFLIKERGASGESVTTYEVFDPQTQNQVGIIREESGCARTYLPSFLKRVFRSTKLEALRDARRIARLHRPADRGLVAARD